MSSEYAEYDSWAFYDFLFLGLIKSLSPESLMIVMSKMLLTSLDKLDLWR